MRRTTRAGRLQAAVIAIAIAGLAAGCGTSDSGGAEPSATKTVASTADLKVNPALHDALPADIRTKGTLTLATDPSDPPLEFYDEDNKLIGAEVDLANALGVVLGVKVKLVPAKFDAIIPGIQAGRYDGSVSGFADRVDRQKIVDIVDYFVSSRAYLVKTSGLADLEAAKDLCGRKVAVAKGTTMADSILTLSSDCESAGKPAIGVQNYPDQNACVLAVQSGRADLTILSDHAALWISKTSKGALDVILLPDEGNDINGIVLKKGELVAPVQKAIQQLMDSGKFEEIFTKWNLQKLMGTEATVNAGVN